MISFLRVAVDCSVVASVSVKRLRGEFYSCAVLFVLLACAQLAAPVWGLTC